MLEEPKIKKVDKRDKQLPQNFEQLIEMYDVEKIWPYMKKVIDYINNDLEKIKVSPTQPTTNEKVWIQKGKNLSKVNKIDRVNSGGSIVKINVKENTDYTISAIKSRIDGVNISNINIHGVGSVKAYDRLGNELENLFRDNAHYLEKGSCKFDFAITTPSNCAYIVIDFGNNNGDANLNITVTEIQVEEGPATPYEPYIEPRIYCKNDNGVFKEFLNVEKVNNLTEDIEMSDITVAPSTTCQVGQSVAKDGYEALGIIMCDMSSNHVLLAKYAVWGDMAYLNLANYSESSQTTSITIRVLYKKL